MELNLVPASIENMKIAANSNPDQIVSTLVKEFNYAVITKEQLADIMNFTQNQKDLMKYFWNSVRDKKLIYLGDQIIKKYFTAETGKNLIPHFIERDLKKKFKVGQDYFEIDANHESVMYYNKNYLSPKLGINIKPARGAPKSNFYAVTCECFEHLLLNAGTKIGTETRAYFQALKRMIDVLEKYNAACARRVQEFKDNEKELLLQKIQQLEIENKQKEFALTQKELALTKKDVAIRGMNSLIQNTYIAQPRSFIYVGTCKRDINQMILYFGITTDLESRAKNYNSAKQITDDEKFYYIYFRATTDPRNIEDKLKKRFYNMLVRKPHTEVIQMRPDCLITLIDASVDYHDRFDYIAEQIYKATTTEEYYNMNFIEQYPSLMPAKPLEITIPKTLTIENGEAKTTKRSKSKVLLIDSATAASDDSKTEEKYPDESKAEEKASDDSKAEEKASDDSKAEEKASDNAKVEEKAEENEEHNDNLTRNIRAFERLSNDEQREFLIEILNMYIRQDEQFKNFDFEKVKDENKIRDAKGKEHEGLSIKWSSFKNFVTETNLDVVISKIMPVKEKFKDLVKNTIIGVRWINRG